jgi:hypothetical protein
MGVGLAQQPRADDRSERGAATDSRYLPAIPGYGPGLPAVVTRPNALRSAGSSRLRRITACAPVHHVFTPLRQVPIMPQAMVGIRPPIARQGRARTPRITWTTLKLPGRGYRTVNWTGLGVTWRSSLLPARITSSAVRLSFRQFVRTIFAHGPCDPGNPRGTRFSGGSADCHHNLRHDPNLADRCEEMVDAVAIRPAPPEPSERPALGRGWKVRTGQAWLTSGHDDGASSVGASTLASAAS